MCFVVVKRILDGIKGLPGVAVCDPNTPGNLSQYKGAELAPTFLPTLKCSSSVSGKILCETLVIVDLTSTLNILHELLLITQTEFIVFTYWL